MEKQKRYQQYMYSYPHKRAYGPLEEDSIKEAFDKLKGQEITLYIHIPFCSSKCGYCNLFSVIPWSGQVMESYIEAVCRQILQYSSYLKEDPAIIKQVVIGGGTPFLLTIEQLEKLFNTVESHFHTKLCECGLAIETSPNDTTLEKLEYLKSRGMKRVSLGVQTFREEELSQLRRKHSGKSCHKAIRLIKQVEPEYLNLDFIYGIEGQTLDTFKDSLKEALGYGPEELFLYPLYIRGGTPLYKKMEVDEHLQYEMYQYAVEVLEREGYVQTSMRRFTKAVPINEVSCGFEKMLALGCGGRSYAGDIHFCEPYEVNEKNCHEILNNFIGKTNFMAGLKGYRLNKEEQMRRFVIKNLGYYKGVSIREFEQYFKMDMIAQYEGLFGQLIKDGLLYKEDDRIILTKEGRGDSDRVLGLWISDDVRKGSRLC